MIFDKEIEDYQQSDNLDRVLHLNREQLQYISSTYSHDRAILDHFFIDFQKDNSPDEVWINNFKNRHLNYYNEYEQTWCFLTMHAVAIIWLPIKDDLGEVFFHTMEIRSNGTSSIPSGADERFISVCANSEIDSLLKKLTVLKVVIEKDFREYMDVASVASDIPKIGYD